MCQGFIVRRCKICRAKKNCRSKRQTTKENLNSEPAAAICNPPAEYAERDRSDHSPPKRQDDVGEETKNREAGPEDLVLHTSILVLKSRGRRESRNWTDETVIGRASEPDREGNGAKHKPFRGGQNKIEWRCLLHQAVVRWW